uniref:Cysteine protease n=1 Tax=Ascaris suum TaxID=6253 RepID=F1KYE7_ASCSU
MLDSCLTLEPSFYELQDYSVFDSNTPVYLLGHKFPARGDMDSIKEYVTSRLWFTYRKNFMPIGGTGPTSDQGWGCMLRCGQMLLAQALIVRHLGTEWMWDRDNKEEDYKRILRMFQDKKCCPFSLHQIAQMGVSERKQIGEWFGPNTAAQVLKKLVVYDDWSRLAVHVALDNLLIASDVRTMAHTRPPSRLSSRHTTENEQSEESGNASGGNSLCSFGSVKMCMLQSALMKECDENPVEDEEQWRPLLIIVPLRLGLTSINRCYLPAIEAFFQLPQCTGIIGGRPNHALYFIGIAGEQLIYLDPHVCQAAIDLDERCASLQQQDGFVEVVKSTDIFDDSSYHCPFLLHIAYDSADPSLALSFICRTEEEYEHLANNLKTKVLPASSPPLFELLETRPKGFPPFVPYVGENAKLQDYTDLSEVHDSYDEFEILE